VEDDTESDDSTAVDEEDDDDDSVIIEYEREEGDGQVFLSICSRGLLCFSVKANRKMASFSTGTESLKMNGVMTHKL
jgi:hypothetical protein